AGGGVGPVMLATLLGSRPQPGVCGLLGGGARIGHGGQVGLAAVLFAGSGALGLWLARRMASRGVAPEARSPKARSPEARAPGVP
ncbi:MAG: hypothetical protein ABF665_15875, partial [Gluconacetobacter sp.]